MCAGMTCLEVGTGPSVAVEYVRGARLVRGTPTGFVSVRGALATCVPGVLTMLGALSLSWPWLCAGDTGLCSSLGVLCVLGAMAMCMGH